MAQRIFERVARIEMSESDCIQQSWPCMLYSNLCFATSLIGI